MKTSPYVFLVVSSEFYSFSPYVYIYIFLIQFELIFVYGVTLGSNFIFFMWIYSLPNTIYSKVCPFSIE